jgi:hypothetical protein
MPKYKGGPISIDNVKEMAEQWQRIRAVEIPSLFSAYDKEQKQTERVVSYRLDKKWMQRLHDQVKDKEDFQFIVHLGLLKDHYSEQVPDQPPFVLMLQAYCKASDYHKKCYGLTWASNSKFADAGGTGSQMNAIPAASAYLFVYSWMETPLEELDLPFTSAAADQDLRVQAYIFSKAESKTINRDIGNSLSNQEEEPELCIHLGIGIAVQGHPFGFRPVMEIKNAIPNGKLGKVNRNSTGLTDGNGGSYFDFSNPIPPPPENEG